MVAKNTIWCIFIFVVVVPQVLTLEKNKCLKKGLYEHPSDCTKFYSCAPIGPVLMHCPNGLHFNPQNLMCDWPQNPRCMEKSTEQAGNTLQCPVYPHPEDCTKFYQCSSSGPVVIDCPETLHFNPKLLICDWAETAGCIKDQTDTEAPREPTTILTTILSYEKTETSTNNYDISEFSGASTVPINTTYLCKSNIWPHQYDCTKFFMCSSTGPVDMFCPEQMHFNPTLSVCDSPHNAGCIENLNVTSEITTTELTTDLSTNTLEIVTTEHLSASTIDMENLETTTITDLDKATTDGYTETLNIDEYTTKEPQPTSITTQSLETTLVNNTTESSSGFESINSSQPCQSNIWPHPHDCTKFFMCSSTGPLEMFCPEKLHFNAALSICDLPQTAGCKAHINVTHEMTTVDLTPDASATTLTTRFSETETTEYISASTFNMENLETTSVGDLKKTTIADLLLSTDVYTETLNADKYTTKEPQVTSITTQNLETTLVNNTTESSTVFESINSSQPCQSNIWPHPHDCTKFFMCSSTGPLEMFCPEKLHFNAALSVCDLPNNAKCKAHINMTHEMTTADLPPNASTTSLSETETTEHISASTSNIENLETTTIENLNKTTIVDLLLSTNVYTETLNAGEYTTKEPQLTSITTQNLETTLVNNTTESSTVFENINSSKPCQSNIWPHPHDCTKFFMCSSTGPLEMFCPEKLHFNAALSVCDLPNNAGCKAHINMTHEMTTVDLPPDASTTSFSETETIEHISASTIDMENLESTTIEDLNKTTIADLLLSTDVYTDTLNTEKYTTKKPQLTSITTQSLETTLVNNTTESSTVFENINSSEPCKSNIWPHPHDCTKFFMCSSTGPLEMFCPEKLHFNAAVSVCDLPNNAGCKAHINMTHEMTTVDLPPDASTTSFSETETTEHISASTIDMENIETNTIEDLNKTTIADLLLSTDVYTDTLNTDKYTTKKPQLTSITTQNLETTLVNNTTESSIVFENINSSEPCQSNIWPHPHDCTKFFMCSSTGPLEMFCPEKLHFNAALSVCDLPNNAGCKAHINMTPEMTTVDLPPDASTTSFSETETTEHISASTVDMENIETTSIEDLNKTTIADLLLYTDVDTETSNGNEYTTKEPQFTSITTQNLETTLVNTTTESSTVFESINSSELCKSNIWPHPNECMKFFMCTSTGPLEISCPEIFHFNAALSVCDWPHNAGCKEYINVTHEVTTIDLIPDTATTTLTTSSSETEKTEHISASTIDMDNLETTTIEDLNKTTIVDLLISTDVYTEAFNTEEIATKEPQLTSITTQSLETTNINNTTESSSVFESIDNSKLCKNTIWPHPHDCTKFFMCGSTGPVEIFCPEQLHFNAAFSVCDWPHNAKCKQHLNVTHETITEGAFTTSFSESQTTEHISQSTINMENLESTTVKSSMVFNSTELCKSNIWPHSHDCTKFFMCGSTGPVEMFCPEQLHFNPAFSVCDWPHNAGCKQHLNATLELTTAGYISTSTVGTEHLETTIVEDLGKRKLALKNILSGEVHSDTPEFSTLTIEDNTTKELTTSQKLETAFISTSQSTPTHSSTNRKKLCQGPIWPHPDDCKKFFMCGSTGAVEMYCPEQLYFNPALLVCDRVYNAACKAH